MTLNKKYNEQTGQFYILLCTNVFFEKLNALLKKSSVSTVKESKKQSDAVFG